MKIFQLMDTEQPPTQISRIFTAVTKHLSTISLLTDPADTALTRFLITPILFITHHNLWSEE